MAKKLSSLAELSSSLVYSTDSGRHCPDCGKPFDECICKQQVVIKGDGVVRIGLEKKGRGGKTVTVIKGLPLVESELKELTTVLKRRCGTGGTLKDEVIEIQGEHVALLIAEISKQGFVVKKSGG